MRKHLSWRDLSIARKGLLVIAIPVLPLLLTAAMYVHGERAYQEAQADTERVWRLRTNDLALQARLFEAESAVRAYVLLRDERLLAPQKDVRADAAAVLADLELQTQDPEQRQRLPALRSVVMARLDALDALTRTASSGGTRETLAAHVQAGTGVMNTVRAELGQLLARNAVLLAERMNRSARLRRRLNATVVAGAAAGVLGGVIAALMFTTGVSRRLALAGGNVSRLADGEPVVATDAAADEIGQLTAETERASRLLALRDTQLRQRMTELESLTRELEAFSYSVSHDLRAPLRHVAGFAALLQKSAGGTLSEQQQRFIRTIVEAATRMGRLIDDLLAFSRTGRAELRRSDVDLEAVVRDARQQATADANGRRIRWMVHPLPRIAGDPAMLRIVFDNLLANAVKYTRPRDEAHIEVGHRASEQGDAIVFVRDNGVGFDMQYQHKLFGVFQRLHTSDDFEGTGIGLATVRRIVARHGGRTWAEGRPGEGATFYVSLPREETQS